MTGNRIRRRVGPAVALLGVVALGGCAGPDTASAPASTTNPTTPPTSATAASACQAVLASGKALGTAVVRFVGGAANADQVRTAAQHLSSTLNTAQATTTPQGKTALQDAQAAVQRLLAALRAQPIDRAAVRAAAGDAINAGQQVAASCPPAPA